MTYLALMFLAYLLVTKFDIIVVADNTKRKNGEGRCWLSTLSMPKLVMLLTIVLAFLAPETLPSIINIIHHQMALQ